MLNAFCCRLKPDPSGRALSVAAAAPAPRTRRVWRSFWPLLLWSPTDFGHVSWFTYYGLNHSDLTIPMTSTVTPIRFSAFALWLPTESKYLQWLFPDWTYKALIIYCITIQSGDNLQLHHTGQWSFTAYHTDCYAARTLQSKLPPNK